MNILFLLLSASVAQIWHRSAVSRVCDAPIVNLMNELYCFITSQYRYIDDVVFLYWHREKRASKKVSLVECLWPEHADRRLLALAQWSTRVRRLEMKKSCCLFADKIFCTRVFRCERMKSLKRGEQNVNVLHAHEQIFKCSFIINSNSYY